MPLGLLDLTDGTEVGDDEGLSDLSRVYAIEGCAVGSLDGIELTLWPMLGERDGNIDGNIDGSIDGAKDGMSLGASLIVDGSKDGLSDGENDGVEEGNIDSD